MEIKFNCAKFRFLIIILKFANGKLKIAVVKLSAAVAYLSSVAYFAYANITFILSKS